MATVRLVLTISEVKLVARGRTYSGMIQDVTVHWCRSCTRPCAVAKVGFLTRLFEVVRGNRHGAWMATAMLTLVVSDVAAVAEV